MKNQSINWIYDYKHQQTCREVASVKTANNIQTIKIQIERNKNIDLSK